MDSFRFGKVPLRGVASAIAAVLCALTCAGAATAQATFYDVMDYDWHYNGWNDATSMGQPIFSYVGGGGGGLYVHRDGWEIEFVQVLNGGDDAEINVYKNTVFAGNTVISSTSGPNAYRFLDPTSVTTQELWIFVGTGNGDYIQFDARATHTITWSLDGNDQIEAHPSPTNMDGSYDVVFAGDGSDVIDTTKYIDYLYGDWDPSDSAFTGADQVVSGLNPKWIQGGYGDDWLHGSSDRDWIDGNHGDDVIHGGDGDDVLLGSAGQDEIWGDGGADLIDGGNEYNFLYGGDGDDSMIGGDDGNEMHGGDGHDVMFGGVGSDQMYGDAGNDHMEGGGDVDAMFGGLGCDDMFGDWDYANVFGMNNPNTNGTGAGDEMWGDDHHSVNAEYGDDFMYGGEGTDYMYGGKWRDVMDGGDDADFVYGGEDDDYLHDWDGTAGDELYGESGNDVLHSTDGSGSPFDSLFGGLDTDQFFKDAGDITDASGGETPQAGDPSGYNSMLTTSLERVHDYAMGEFWNSAASGTDRDCP